MGKDDITFRPGKNGVVEAVRDGKVIGCVYTNDNVAQGRKQGMDGVHGKETNKPNQKK